MLGAEGQELLAGGWRVRVDGLLVHQGATHSGATHALPLSFERDAVVTVEVEGEPGDTFEALLPGGHPLAFTNPIFVDADGDGRWQAPGLPERLPAVITRPESTP